MRCDRTDGKARRVRLLTLVALCAALVALGETARALAQEPDQTIYRYVDRTGRPVFVNGLSRVPARFRARARPIDVSRVSLNTELGRALHDEVEREYERLKARERAALEGESRCGEVRGEGALGWLKRLWAEHSHLLVIGAVLLALGIATPFVVRHVPVDRWVRVLMVAVPLLACIAVMATAAVRTSGALRAARGACPPGTRDEAAEIGPVQDLREALRQAKQQRRELERELERR